MKREDFVSLDQVNNSYQTTQTLVRDMQNRFNKLLKNDGNHVSPHHEIKMNSNKKIRANGGLCIGNTCIGERELKYLTSGFTLRTIYGGHHDEKRFHTHGDGVMRVADHVHRTTYKMGDDVRAY